MPYIYGLVDPKTSQLRYVGKADNPYVRLTSGHLVYAQRGDSGHKYNWIRSLLLESQIPRLVILEACTEDEWSECERKWIRCLRERGFPLTNVSSGGDGGWEIPIESRRLAAQKMNEYNKSHPLPPERIDQCRQLGLSRRGASTPVETRQKISQALRDLYAVGAIQKPFLGKRHTDDTKKVMSDKKKTAYVGSGNPFYGKHHSAEVRANIGRKSGASRLGKKRGPYKKRIQTTTAERE